MKTYAIGEYCYIYDNKDINVLTGTKDEADDDYSVPCFNGVAFFKSKGNHYKMTYPKFNELTDDDKFTIENYCGFYPHAGEYNAVCSTFGEVKKISKKEFEELTKNYPLKKKHIENDFAWWN